MRSFFQNWFWILYKSHVWIFAFRNNSVNCKNWTLFQLKYKDKFDHHHWSDKGLWIRQITLKVEGTGWPKKHGNSVTNLISSLLCISIVIPNFKSHSIIMSVLCRVYFMKRVRDCKDIVSARWTVKTDKITLSTAIFLFY